MISTSTRPSSTRPSPAAPPSRAVSAPLVITLSIVVIALVTLGKPFVDIPGLVDGPAHAVRSHDTKLFDGFDRPNYWYDPWTNSLGNIALFVCWAAGRSSRSKSSLVAGVARCAASVGIEITQYLFALGYTDIDDLFINAIGGILGAGLLVVIPRREHPGLMRLTAVLLSLLLAGMTVLGLRYHL